MEPELDPPALVVLHATCMILSWGFLLPLGAIWARNLRQSTRKPYGVPIWFAGHRLIQSTAWFFALVGFACMIAHKQRAGKLAKHFTATHEVVGLVLITLLSLQPLNAMLRHLPFIGHPAADGSRTLGRKVWERLHKGIGYSLLFCGMAQACGGLEYVNEIGYAKKFLYGAAIPLATSLGSQLICAVVLEVRRRRRFSPQSPGSPLENDTMCADAIGKETPKEHT